MPVAIIFNLAWNQLTSRVARAVLTILCVGMAVALVVGVTTGYASLETSLRTFAARMMGGTDFELTSASRGTPGVPQSTLNELRDDPRVRSSWGRLEASRTPVDADGKNVGEVAIRISGIEIEFDANIRQLPVVEGRWFTPGEKRALVIDPIVAESLKAKVGDTIRFNGAGGKSAGTLDYTVVGIIHKPRILANLVQSAYMSIENLRELSGMTSMVLAKVQGEFETRVDSAQFVADWEKKLAGGKNADGVETISLPIDIKLTRDTREDLDRNLLAMRLMSMIGGAIAMLAATFIVFTTLSMGVAERQRTLAMFRAIGGTRGQVIQSVVVEAVLIALAGLAIGIPLGLFGVWVLSWKFSSVFTMGISISTLGMVFASIVSIGSAVLASLLPAWRASRVDPLEAMRPHADPPASTLPIRSFFFGLLLLSLDTLIVLFPAEWIGLSKGGVFERELRLVLHFGLGLPSLFAGFFLIAPMVIWAFEVVLAPVIAKVCRVPINLLRQQLTGAIWRAAGTCGALMVGLAVLVVMRTQGHSALSSWQLPEKFPDLFLYADQIGPVFTNDAVDKIRQIPGVLPGTVLPVTITYPGLGQDVWKLATAGRIPEATMFIGIDPLAAANTVELDFREGSEFTATRMLDRGRRVTLNDGTVLHGTIVTEANLIPAIQSATQPKSESTTRPATQTAVATSVASSVTYQLLDDSTRTIPVSDIKSDVPGRYLVVTQELKKLKGLGVGDKFTLTRGLLRSQIIEYTIVGVVWSPGIELIINSFDLQGQLERQTASAVFGTIKSAQDDLDAGGAKIVAINVTPGIERQEMLDRVRGVMNDQSVNIGDIRHVKFFITETFSRIMLLASTVAWAAMIVSALGVTNAIVASVRSRMWQLGVLRAIGLSRAVMSRLLIIEGLSLGLIGCVIGVMAGLLMAFNARKFSAAMIGFDPPVLIPWADVLLGCFIMILLSLIATLIPALRASRKPVLEMLSAGRSSS